MPQKRFTHPVITAEKEQAEQLNTQHNTSQDSMEPCKPRKHISITMRANREQTLVEFPIDSARSDVHKNLAPQSTKAAKANKPNMKA